MSRLAEHLLTGFDWFVLAYFLALNSGYLVLIALATRDVTGWLRRASFAGHDDIFANPLTPGVSVIVPAYNEELTVVESVRAMLALKYPALEVIVVEDGSTDGTFRRLRDAFDLVEIERVIPAEVPSLGTVHSTHARAGRDAAGRAQGQRRAALRRAQRRDQCGAPAAGVSRRRRFAA